MACDKLINISQWGLLHETKFLARLTDIFHQEKMPFKIDKVEPDNQFYCVDFIVKKNRRKRPLCYVELKSRQNIPPSYGFIRIGHTKMLNIREEIVKHKKSNAILVWWCVKSDAIYYTPYSEEFCKYEKWFDKGCNSAYILIHMSKIKKSTFREFAYHIMSVSSAST